VTDSALVLSKYRLLAETMHDVAIFVGGDGRIIEVNAAAVKTYGRSADELVGSPAAQLCYRGDRCAIQRTLETGEARICECVHRRADGTLLPLEVSTVRADIGGEHLVLCVARDVAQRHRRELLQAIVHEIDSAILAGQPQEATLEFICSQLVSLNGYALVQISIKERDGLVSIQGSAGAAAGFLDDIHVRWDSGSESLGPTGRAIREGHVQICDIESDPDFEVWRSRAAAHGLRSSMSLPLAAHGQTLGALTLFSTAKNAFSEAMNDEMGSFADEIALSILAGMGNAKIRLQRVALEAAANAIVITDVHGVIEWVNPAFTTLTGWTAEEAVGETPRMLRSGNHSRAFYTRMWQQLNNGEVWRGEMFNRRKDGTIYPEEQTITPVRDEKGRIAHFVAIKQDISDRKRQEEQIRFLALHDVLTALPNRRAFDATLARFTHDANTARNAAILVLDVDEFKLVNDSAGHPVGDELLIELTSLLQAQLRPGDFLARLGGDEFVVLLRNVGKNLAHDIAERLRRAVEAMWFEHDGIVYSVTISVGIAMLAEGDDPKDLVAHADMAMYSAKEHGKNRVASYPLAKGEVVHEVTRWLAKVRSSLRDGSFILTFQPIAQLGNGETLHFEALIRMRAEDGSIIPPGNFLPSAERYGLMPQIDRWVFDEVARILESEASLRIFMNLSARSLSDEPLLQHIEERLRGSSIEPGRLSFEITETAAVADLASARNWIRRLKDLGCLIALDDFGAGFSSFGYLQALAVDYIKIDRTFVHDLDTNATNRALVQAVNTVARTLGKEVIAEGVECEAHADALRAIGIENGQGYHWGIPEELEATLLGMSKVSGYASVRAPELLSR
jgi:diguanylate cyclase (GGDEF)-like protein/PAS domain S-box-containing protein